MRVRRGPCRVKPLPYLVGHLIVPKREMVGIDYSLLKHMRTNEWKWRSSVLKIVALTYSSFNGHFDICQITRNLTANQILI